MSRDKKTRILILVLLSLAVLTIMIFSILPESPANTLSTPLSVLLRPVENTFNSIGGTLKTYFTAVKMNRELQAENDQLKSDNLALRLKIKDNEQAAEAYASLKQAFGLKDKFPERKFVAANILQRPLEKEYEYYRLDVGTADGIDFTLQSGFAVVDENANIIGTIVRADGISSKMISLNHQGFSCTGFAEKDAANSFLVKGQGLDQEDYLLGVDIPEETNLAVGDKVYSSGRGGIFPEGLLCGTVVSISSPNALGFRTCEIEVASQLKELNVLFVLLPSDEYAVDSTAESENRYD